MANKSGSPRPRPASTTRTGSSRSQQFEEKAAKWDERVGKSLRKLHNARTGRSSA